MSAPPRPDTNPLGFRAHPAANAGGLARLWQPPVMDLAALALMRANREVSLTKDPEPPAAADGPEPEEKLKRKPSFWASFSSADMRNLVVTVAGPVIGGILGVMLVAIGIILAKKFAGNPGGWAEGLALDSGAMRRYRGPHLRLALGRVNVGCYVLAGIYGLRAARSSGRPATS